MSVEKLCFPVGKNCVKPLFLPIVTDIHSCGKIIYIALNIYSFSFLYFVLFRVE